jgi:hypothetical protein
MALTPYAPATMFKVPAQYFRENPRHFPTQVVILGAGASIQAFPNGDGRGRELPHMGNLIDVVGLADRLQASGILPGESNFEVIYSRLNREESLHAETACLEKAVQEYFAQMELPAQPTLYDHLLLSLRHLDLVATFNWDPLLFDAWQRLRYRFGVSYLPSVAYLHGNVRIGYCRQHKMFGENGLRCEKCDQILTPIPLLYPVAQKDYSSDSFIADAWNRVKYALDRAIAITVFGYGAPASDNVAVELMKAAWSGKRKRKIESTFIIDKRSENELEELWKPFIYHQHYKIVKDFYRSTIPRFARRCGEMLVANSLEGRFVDELPIPCDATWDELETWFWALADVEDAKLNSR